MPRPGELVGIAARRLTPVPSASSTSASVASCARAAVHRPVATSRSRSASGVDAAAVVGDLEHEQVAVLARADRDRRGRAACRARRARRAARSPCATALRSSCVIGSTSCSATALSNSVSSPSVRSSTRTPVARRSARSVRAACVIRFCALSMRMRTSPRCSSPIVRRSASISSSSAAVVCESRAAWPASSLSASRDAHRGSGCARSRRAGPGACARDRGRACAAAGRAARCACDRTAARPPLDISASIRSGSTRRYDFGSGTARCRARGDPTRASLEDRGVAEARRSISADVGIASESAAATGPGSPSSSRVAGRARSARSGRAAAADLRLGRRRIARELVEVARAARR